MFFNKNFILLMYFSSNKKMQDLHKKIAKIYKKTIEHL